MELKIVPPPPPQRALTLEERLYRRIHELDTEIEKQRAQTDFWLQAWKEVIGDVGDLLHRVRCRKKGRKVVSVLDLMNVLRRAETGKIVDLETLGIWEEL